MGDNQAQEVLVAAVTEKVNRWLAEFVGGYEVSQNGRVSFRFGSARIFVGVEPWSDENCLVRVGTMLLMDVPKSAELNEWIAYNTGNYFFGTTYLAEDQDNNANANVIIDHVLLGDYIDVEELRSVVGAVATTADELDTVLKDKFGGDTYHEDVD